MLSRRAKPGQILISPRVLMAVENDVLVESVGEFELKGIRRPMSAYDVLSAGTPKKVAWIALASACGPISDIGSCTVQVCFWPLADTRSCTAPVRFQGYSEHGVPPHKFAHMFRACGNHGRRLLLGNLRSTTKRVWRSTSDAMRFVCSREKVSFPAAWHGAVFGLGRPLAQP